MKLKIKRILSVACALSLLGSFSASADSVTIGTDLTNDSVAISGTLDTDRAGTDLILRMQNASGQDVLAAFATGRFKNDTVVFEFDDILLPKTLTSGSYRVVISGEELTQPIVTTYEYVGADMLLPILTQVKGAAEVGAVLSANAQALSLDMADYNALTPEGKQLFETLMKKISYDLPESYESDADRAKIKAETAKLLTAYQDAICLALFESIDSTADAAAWLDRYYQALGFDVENPETEYSEKELTDYLNTVRSGAAFSQKLTAATGLDSVEKIKDCLYESALLSVIAEKRSSVVQDMVLKFASLFNLDETAYNALSASKQSSCFESITGHSYATYEAAGTALAAAIKSASSGTGGTASGSTSSGGGGGGRGSSLIVSSPAKTDVADDEKATLSTGFNDCREGHWAYRAVTLLAERGIISGRSTTSFAPDDNVTRAEFIKMITTAMSLSAGDGAVPFVDVAADSWYAPYAAMAYREGLVLGDDAKCFKPNENITREDMASILYRALKVTEEGSGVSFADKDQISDYAVAAVGYFSQKGLINGMDGGKFAPKAAATRAQAAQMLYNIITAQS